MALLTNINGKFSVSDAGAVTFNNAFTFPTADGNANYVLQTNGSGQIGWAANGSVTGSGSGTRVAFWSSGSAITSDADLYWDNTNNRLGIGTDSPDYKLEISDSSSTPTILLGRTPYTTNGTFLIKGNQLTSHTDDNDISTVSVAASRYKVGNGFHQWYTSSGTVAGNARTFTERMRIDSSGNVLINSGVYLSWGTTGATSIEGSTASNKIQFRTNSTDAVIIDSSQNVGIGTTNPLHDLQIGDNGVAGSYSMMIEGQFASVALASNPRLNLIDTNFGITAGKYGSGGTNDAIGIFAFQGAGRGILFAHTTAGSGTTLQDMRHDMFIDGAAGNVGIGTTSPTNGKLEIQQTATTSALWVQTGGTTSSYTIADFRTGTNLSALAIKGDGKSIFNGNVGIGETAPGALLDVGGYVQMDSYVANESGNNPFNSGYLKIISGAKTGWGIGDELGKINFYGSDTSGIGARNAASIVAVCETGNGTSTTTFSSGLAFYTSSSNAAQEERMRITSGGQLQLQGSSSSLAKSTTQTEWAYIPGNTNATLMSQNPSGMSSASAGYHIVYGANNSSPYETFIDVITYMCGSSTSVTTISSTNLSGSPGSRSYSKNSSAVILNISGSADYNCNVKTTFINYPH